MEANEQGLIERSRKPHVSPGQKITEQHINYILALREGRNLGARRIQTELIRLHECFLSLVTIHKVLVSQQVKAIKKLKRKKKFKRYNRPIPGDRIQMDTCKIAPGIYQYTAIDDCSRWRVLELYSRRTAANTLDFIDVMVEQFPFPIQRIQTDRGRWFIRRKTPSEMSSDLADKTPFWDEVIANYEIQKERIQEPNYQIDLIIRKLKRCL